MATYRVKQTLTGYIDGQLWPSVGEEIDLGDADFSSMVDAGHLERVKAEKKAPAKKAAAKPDESEKRPAAKKAEEKR